MGMGIVIHRENGGNRTKQRKEGECSDSSVDQFCRREENAICFPKINIHGSNSYIFIQFDCGSVPL
jgi:hypothetical protein